MVSCAELRVPSMQGTSLVVADLAGAASADWTSCMATAYDTMQTICMSSHLGDRRLPWRCIKVKE